jgi:hypothetical protein
LTETLLIDDSTFIKMKRLRDAQDENAEWGDYNPLNQWENENEKEQKEAVEEEEEEEEKEEETAFPRNSSMCCGFTWEIIEELLKEGT